MMTRPNVAAKPLVLLTSWPGFSLARFTLEPLNPRFFFLSKVPPCLILLLFVPAM